MTLAPLHAPCLQDYLCSPGYGGWGGGCYTHNNETGEAGGAPLCHNPNTGVDALELDGKVTKIRVKTFPSPVL